ncbi:A24 family peptidase [Comamonas humi]
MRYTLVPLLLWLITIAVADLRIRKVRNWMVLLGLGTGLATLFSGGQPFQVDAWSGLLGMLAAAAALLPFYALRWMGAGDVKFAAVMGLWFGLSPGLLLIWLGGSLLAGLHGMAVLAWRGFQRSPYGPVLQANLPARWAHVLAMPSAPASNTVQRSIPYAGYMALAAIWLVLARGAP